VLTGPQLLNVTKPFSQIPMWHRRGGLVVTTDSTALRIAEQDWHHLTINAWPAVGAPSTSRTVYVGDRQITIVLSSDDDGASCVDVKASANPESPTGGGDHDVQTRAVTSAWVLRLHLAAGERLAGAAVHGGQAEVLSDVRHLEPNTATRDCADHFPFSGAGSGPACAAGPIAEMRIGIGSAAGATTQHWAVRAVVAAAAGQ
jgi:hypothetical protein